MARTSSDAQRDLDAALGVMARLIAEGRAAQRITDKRERDAAVAANERERSINQGRITTLMAERDTLAAAEKRK